MHVQEIGATGRRKLGLHFMKKPATKPQHCASPILSNIELRRLVAEMVD